MRLECEEIELYVDFIDGDVRVSRKDGQNKLRVLHEEEENVAYVA